LQKSFILSIDNLIKVYYLIRNQKAMFEKEIVLDGRGHLLGRLASKVAKELLNG
jgi:large subunit ribosomal protein L13Ae